MSKAAGKQRGVPLILVCPCSGKDTCPRLVKVPSRVTWLASPVWDHVKPTYLEQASGSFLNRTKQLLLVLKNFSVAVGIFMSKANRVMWMLSNWNLALVLEEMCFSLSFRGISRHVIYYVHILFGKNGEKEKRKCKEEGKETEVWEQRSPRKKETIGCLCMTLFHMELMVV